MLSLLFFIFAIHTNKVQAGVTLVDDVSITIDGVEQIVNGDFSEGLIHWSTWDDDPASTREINNNHYISSTSSYQVNFKVDWWGPMSTRTFYDTQPIYEKFNGGQAYSPDSSIWIQASPGQEVKISFKYKGKMGPSFILCLRNTGDWFNLVNQRHWGSWEWTYAEMTNIIPDDGVAIGFQFDVGFDDNGPSVDLEPNVVSGNRGDIILIAAHILNNNPEVVNPVDIHLFSILPSGKIVILKRLQRIDLTPDFDDTEIIFQHVFRYGDRSGNYDFFALIKDSIAGNYFPSIGYFPFKYDRWRR